MTSDKDVNLVDLEKVIRSQKNKKISKLPRFVINILKKIIKEKELNDVILNNKGKTGVEFIKGAFEYLNIKVNLINEENFPTTGKCVFVSNHPLGGVDAGAIVLAVSQRTEDFKIIANEILSHVEYFKEFILPVTVFGKNSKENYQRIEKILHSENVQLVNFPAGMVSRKTNGTVNDLDWRPSFVAWAGKYKRDIVPIFIDEINSKKFYRVNKIRKFFGIKINIELFLLPSEVFKKRNKTINLIVGKPIQHSTFDKDKSAEKWAQEVKDIAYSLKGSRNN